ncbi:MAG TPA: hypothetical protein VLL52_17360 [Anaerolineae bacterium]|nr:hypothetical protein [Anaerolineae bacterium]
MVVYSLFEQWREFYGLTAYGEIYGDGMLIRDRNEMLGGKPERVADLLARVAGSYEDNLLVVGYYHEGVPLPSEEGDFVAFYDEERGDYFVVSLQNKAFLGESLFEDSLLGWVMDTVVAIERGN